MSKSEVIAQINEISAIVSASREKLKKLLAAKSKS